MRFLDSQRWLSVFGFDPSNLGTEELRHLTSGTIREMCNDLNQRADRRDIAQGIRRLEQAGKLLEDYHWLRDNI